VEAAGLGGEGVGAEAGEQGVRVAEGRAAARVAEAGGHELLEVVDLPGPRQGLGRQAPAAASSPRHSRTRVM
jgi:hypothetical protein